MGLKVFLVEDNTDTRRLLTCLLELSGHEVRSASSVQSALAALGRWPCDVLVSDIGLPDGSGVELAEALKRRGELPFAIAVSGFGTAADVAASLAAGFAHHLVKPIELEMLDRLLQEAPGAR
ncbi:response regulator [Aquincola sp. MAHUQ-54]|uniref:Response regulator n=1 Tax=Aquincola agrisoli TaxID=3119538 RepID=A0AAW9QMH2_9BURK